MGHPHTSLPMDMGSALKQSDMGYCYAKGCAIGSERFYPSVRVTQTSNIKDYQKLHAR